jgi:hypothetical protein
VNQETSTTFFKESVVSETGTITLNDNFGLDDNGTICTPGVILSEVPATYSNGVINMEDLNESEDKTSLRQAMAYYHIYGARKAAIETLFSENFPFMSDEVISFGVDQTGQAELMVGPKNGNIDIQLRKGPGYNPFSEDAFAIANGYFQALHYKIVDGDIPEIEGVSLGLASYFAHRYMTMNSYNTNTAIFTYGGKGSSLWAVDLDIELDNVNYNEYGSFNFINFAQSPKQSEILSAALWKLSQTLPDEVDGNVIIAKGETKVDMMVTNALSQITATDLDDVDEIEFKQAFTAQILYNQAVLNGLGEDDLCIILELFYEVYGNKFITTENNLTLPSTAGDIYIADNPTDIGIETPPSYYVCNSPDIWNRNIADGFANSTSQKADLRQVNESGDLEDFHLNYLYIKLNGDLCDLTSAHSPDNMQLKVYYNTANGIKWPADWEHDDNDGTDDHVSGDLIGTIDLNTRNCVYDDESMDDAPLDILKRGNHTIIQIPWRNYLNPNSAYVKKLHHDFNYLARLTSESFDPISVTENQNVINNAQKNNNIALKKSGYYVWQPAPGPNSAGGATPGGIIPQGAGPGIILTGDPDPNDPTVRFTVRPSSHDPVPVDPDPNDTEEPEFPIRQVFNDYNDFGDIVIILDPELYQSWTTGGQRGIGFTLNADNEIVVNHRDFFIEGISLPGINVYSAIRVKFVPHGSTLPTRTAFDLVQWSVASGKQLDAVHVEVRSADEGRSSSRSSLSEDQSDNISIYPNPAQDYFTITSNALASAKMDVYSVSNERMNVSYNTIDTNTTRVNIENLSAGIYFVRIQRTERLETIKFVKF